MVNLGDTGIDLLLLYLRYTTRMKTIQIVLLILIIIGLGLLASQKYWVPELVSFILEHESTTPQLNNYEVVEEAAVVTEVPNSDMDTWNWVTSGVTTDGLQFSYPDPFPVTYITPQEWPPVVTVTKEPFSCSNEVSLSTGTYCIVKTSEGAAGSVFTTYEYKTTKDDSLVTINFTLRTPQCMNYEPGEQEVCTAEQTNFNVDALTERIVSTLQTP